MHSVSLLGTVSQHISYMRRQRLKAHLNNKISGICDLKYDEPQKLLFGDDFSASLARAEQKKRLADTVTKPHQQDFRDGTPRQKPPFYRKPQVSNANRGGYSLKSSNTSQNSTSTYKTNRRRGKQGYRRSKN